MRIEAETLALGFGAGVTTAPVTVRCLDEVRPMLRDPEAFPALWERLTRGS